MDSLRVTPGAGMLGTEWCRWLPVVGRPIGSADEELSRAAELL